MFGGGVRGVGRHDMGRGLAEIMSRSHFDPLSQNILQMELPGGYLRLGGAELFHDLSVAAFLGWHP